MKRFSLSFVLVALMSCVGFAEEKDFANMEYPTAKFGTKITNGGFYNCGGNRSGGFGEFGFSLIDENKNHIVLRECITVGGYGNAVGEKSMDISELQIGDKLIFGGMYDGFLFKVRSYGFLNVGIGLWSDSENKFASGSPLLEIGGGGGFEFQYSSTSAFVIEFGGRSEAPVGKEKGRFDAYTNSSPTLTIGFRCMR